MRAQGSHGTVPPVEVDASRAHLEVSELIVSAMNRVFADVLSVAHDWSKPTAKQAGRADDLVRKCVTNEMQIDDRALPLPTHAGKGLLVAYPWSWAGSGKDHRASVQKADQCEVRFIQSVLPVPMPKNRRQGDEMAHQLYMVQIGAFATAACFVGREDWQAGEYHRTPVDINPRHTVLVVSADGAKGRALVDQLDRLIEESADERSDKRRRVGIRLHSLGSDSYIASAIGGCAVYNGKVQPGSFMEVYRHPNSLPPASLAQRLDPHELAHFRTNPGSIKTPDDEQSGILAGLRSLLPAAVRQHVCIQGPPGTAKTSIFHLLYHFTRSRAFARSRTDGKTPHKGFLYAATTHRVCDDFIATSAAWQMDYEVEFGKPDTRRWAVVKLGNVAQSIEHPLHWKTVKEECDSEHGQEWRAAWRAAWRADRGQQESIHHDEEELKQENEAFNTYFWTEIVKVVVVTTASLLSSGELIKRAQPYVLCLDEATQNPLTSLFATDHPHFASVKLQVYAGGTSGKPASSPTDLLCLRQTRGNGACLSATNRPTRAGTRSPCSSGSKPTTRVPCAT
jgi:hypothetical protein